MNWIGAARRAGIGVACLGATLVAPSVLLGHEFWLSPSRYDASPGSAVEIGAHVGDGFIGPIQGFPADRAVRFEARMARTFPLVTYTRGGSLTWASLSPVDDGGILVAWESGFLRNELPAERFEKYLEEDGLDGALALRRERGDSGPGVERYRRCAKTWIDGGEAARATAVVGLPFEIVPASTPGRQASLWVQVRFEGKPISGVLVRAWHAPLGQGMVPTDPANRTAVEDSWRGRTDEYGRVEIPCSEPGEWMISAVHMVPSADRSAAAWESSWASLTFARHP